jgi:hypothetical protein
MHQWSPFWRWLAVGVLAAMTITWVAQTHARGHESGFGASHESRRVQNVSATPGKGSACTNGQGMSVMVAGRDSATAQQVCVNVPGATVDITGDGSSVAVSPDPRVTAALQRQRDQLQRQEAELQQQQAQLSARMAALQARLNSLGQ